MGNAGIFEETSEATGFPHSLFSLRVKQFKTRIRSHVLRAGEDLSSLIEENIPEKRRRSGFLFRIQDHIHMDSYLLLQGGRTRHLVYIDR